MDEALRKETGLLRQSWERHDPDTLRDYLVAGVEDPRINLQSIFTRHFLIRGFAGDAFSGLMEHECRFSAVMNWLALTVRKAGDVGALEALIHALERRSDNAEGLEIPRFVLQICSGLPARCAGLEVPNYIKAFLRDAIERPEVPTTSRCAYDVFAGLWRMALANAEAGTRAPALSVVEAACGSANDYRALEACGIAGRINYTGFDLSPKNVANAQAMFPRARFAVGNAFEIDAPDQGYDVGFAHDLFEHLSPAGLQVAIRELCRVSRLGLCAGFFSMDEIANHIVRPLDQYHWNTLSMRLVREAFAREGFACRVIHVASFLLEFAGCATTHNPTAYSFLCWRRA